MGLVIFVFATVLMLAEGFQQTLITSGSPENAVFIRRSAETEVQSIIERKDAAIIESFSQVAVDKDWRRLAAREVVVLISLRKKETGLPSNVQVRGVTHGISLELRPQIKIVAGREFNAGSSEILIGRNIAKKFRIAGLGGTINFGGRTWTVAGIMDAGGTAFDSEIWGDVDTLMGAFKRPVYSSVIIRMRDPSGLRELKETVLKDPRLVEEARREDEYYEAQSELMARFIRILGISLTLIFSLGAITGSMITMYAAVAARTSEIGTLRALGFRRVFILLAFLARSGIFKPARRRDRPCGRLVHEQAHDLHDELDHLLRTDLPLSSKPPDNCRLGHICRRDGNSRRCAALYQGRPHEYRFGAAGEMSRPLGSHPRSHKLIRL